MGKNIRKFLPGSVSTVITKWKGKQTNKKGRYQILHFDVLIE